MTDSEQDAGRLAKLPPGELTAEQRVVYDAIVSGRSQTQPVDAAGQLTGPFNAMLYSPVVGNALQGLGAAIRFQGTLPPRCREIAILIVAVHAQSAYELLKHAPAARQAGVTESELAALLGGDDSAFVDDVERAVISATRRLVATADLTDSEYLLAEQALGPAFLVELSTLIGYYTLLALQLRIFRVPLPSE